MVFPLSRRSFKRRKQTTFYACDRKDLKKVQVSLQRSFKGPSYVLSSDTASIACATLGVKTLLAKLNEDFRTYFPLTSAREALLQRCIDSGYDFGTASSFLRTVWKEDPAYALDIMDKRRSEDEELRRSALKGDYVTLNVPPRRVWDLWSNRVVLYWMVGPHDNIPAVSHSWMAEGLRHDIFTPVNSYEWPIPLPVDTTLEHIRIELLNLLHPRRHLVWLDVLCLRQAGLQENEELRRKEWALDVPTIGAIYLYQRENQVVYYYSGLGRPFRVGDLNSDRHWLNRAWTLQETLPPYHRKIGGEDSESPRRNSENAVEEEQRFWDRLDPRDEKLEYGSFGGPAIGIWALLAEMQRRSASNETDKIAALAHHLVHTSSTVPAYIIDEDPESAWSRLVAVMDPREQGKLLYTYSRPGDGQRSWHPSWSQARRDILPWIHDAEGIDGMQSCVAEAGVYCIQATCLERCLIQGLAKQSNSTDHSVLRTGTLTWRDQHSSEQSFTIMANHIFPIPDGIYTLVGQRVYAYSRWPEPECYHWVVGRADGQGNIRKVSVVVTEDHNGLNDILLQCPISKCMIA